MPTFDPVILGGTDGLNKFHWHEWSDDFDLFLSTSWVITNVGVTPTQAISQAKDGILVITNTAGATDSSFLQARDVASGQVAEHWAFDSTKRLYFEARFKVSDAALSSWVMGLQITDTTPLAVSDGIWFQKASAATKHMDFHVAKSSTQSDLTSFADAASDTYMKLGFYYNASNAFITAYKDGFPVGSLPITNAPSHTLVPSFGIQNGEAVAKIMSIDYIRVLQERG